MGTAVEQKGEGPYHFGCICHSDPWCIYYRDDVFGRGKTSPRGCLDGGYVVQDQDVPTEPKLSLRGGGLHRHVKTSYHVQDLPDSFAHMRERLFHNLSGDCAMQGLESS